MFKTKERDIDKANMKIRDLEWQRNKLKELYENEIDKSDSVRRTITHLERELRSSNIIPDIVTRYYDLIEDKNRIHSLLEQSQSYRVSDANEIKTLRLELCQLQTHYDNIMGLYSGLLQECNTLLTDKRNAEKENKGLKLDIEGRKADYRDIVTECCDLIRERERFLTGTRPLGADKKGLILLKLSSDAMKLLDKMAHRLPEAFTTRDKGYAACIEKLVLSGCVAAKAKKE